MALLDNLVRVAPPGATKFDALLFSASGDRRYLVELCAYDLSAGVERTFRFANRSFTTKRTDDPAHAWYDGRLKNGFVFQRQLFQSGTIGGRSVPGYGALQIVNADGAYDFLENYSVDGRRCTIRLGSPDFAYSEFGVIFDGTMARADFADDVMTIQLRDLQYLLDKPMVANLYGGSGGYDGGPDIGGKRKPRALGRLRAIAPVYLGIIDGYPTFQVNDGPIGDVDVVLDKGSPLTKVAGAPSGGQYQINAARGTFQTGTMPVGQLTCDVRGDARAGATLLRPADIIRDLATRDAGMTAVDTASFSALNALTTASIGFYTGLDDTTFADAFDRMIDSVGGWWGFSRDGALQVGRIDPPDAEPAFWLESRDLIDLTRVTAAPPAWRLVLGYQKVWSVASPNDLAGTAQINDSTRQFLTQEYRSTSIIENAAVKAAYSTAQDLRFDTLLDQLAEAIGERDRLAGVLGVPRAIFTARAKTKPFSVHLGGTVGLRDKRHGLRNGRTFRVIGLSEDSSVNEVELQLWGAAGSAVGEFHIASPAGPAGPAGG